MLVAYAHKGAGPQQRHWCRCLEAFWSTISNVEGRRHLVAIFGFIATCWKAYLVYHVGIDNREAFLLATSHQEGSIHFYIVYVNAVFIKRAAAHVILWWQFAVCRNACLALYQLFNGVARSWRHALGLLFLYLLCLSCLPTHLGDGNLWQGVVAVQHHLQCLLASGAAQHAGFCFIAHHWEAHYHRVGRLQLQREFAFQRGHGYLALLHTGHSGKLHGVRLLVHHLALQRKGLGLYADTSQQSYVEDKE